MEFEREKEKIRNIEHCIEKLETAITKLDTKSDKILTILKDVEIEVATNKIKLAIFSGGIALIISGLVTVALKGL